MGGSEGGRVDGEKVELRGGKGAGLTGYVVFAPVGGEHDDVDEVDDARNADAG